MLKLSKLPAKKPPRVQIREGKLLKHHAQQAQGRELRVKNYQHNTDVIERIGPEQMRASGAVVPVTSAEALKAYRDGAFNRALLATTLVKQR